jgi:KUP system potassium uptake protein
MDFLFKLFEYSNRLAGYNIIVTVHPSYEPHGVISELSPVGEGLDLLSIRPGYMETLNVEALLRERNIDERTIFYGDEEIVSESMIWKIFAFIKDVSPNFVSFYHFPHEKLIGVARRAEI